MTQAFNLSQLANNLNSSGQLDATDGLFGVLPVANGGSGASSYTANNVLLGNGSSTFQTVAPGTSGNALISNGSTWTSGQISKLSTATGNPPSYSCRAFCVWNGVSMDIASSGNISSLARYGGGGPGRYVLTFTTNMPDPNYVVAGTCSRNEPGQDDGNNAFNLSRVYQPAFNQFWCNAVGNATVPIDMVFISAMVLR